VDLLEPFVLNVSKCVSFIPTRGEDVKGYLTADRVCKIVVCKFFFEDFDESGTEAVFLAITGESKMRDNTTMLTLSYASKAFRSSILSMI